MPVDNRTIPARPADFEVLETSGDTTGDSAGKSAPGSEAVPRYLHCVHCSGRVPLTEKPGWLRKVTCPTCGKRFGVSL